MERALPDVWNRKVARLPAEGVLLVSTDLHGNLGDFRRLRDLFLAEEAAGNRPVLAFCGDLVHGPSSAVCRRWPRHLGTYYEDASVQLLREFEQLTRTHRVFSLLGNHEHAHVGGPVVPKFYPDEAAVLEERLGDEADGWRDFMRGFPLVAVAPCGVVLTHGAPAASVPVPAVLEAIDYSGYEELPFHEMRERGVLGALLWSRSCDDASARALVESLLGRSEGFVAFGHDVIREGYAKEGPHHICVSTSFGLRDHAKTYLRLDLSGSYTSTRDLHVGQEIRALYG